MTRIYIIIKSYIPIFEKIRDEYKKYYIQKYGDINCGSREMLILSKLRQQKILPIDEIAIWIDVGLNNVLTSVVGGKNYGLAVLRQQGFDIPKTWSLTINSEINDSFIQGLPKEKTYAVRSSASGEDGQKNSYAGMFDSELDVSIKNIKQAIDKVKKSCVNPRVKAYIDKFNLKKPEMSVVIQEFIEAEISGVWLGRDEDSGVLEWVKGRGDQLVSGKITPNTEMISKNKNENMFLKVNDKICRANIY